MQRYFYQTLLLRNFGGGSLMKKTVHFYTSLAIALSVAFSLQSKLSAGVGTLEQAIPVRPGTLFYSTDRDASTISNGAPVEVPFFGWPGTTGAMADWNGDGIDDKTLYQPSGTGWQTVVAYSSPTGSIANTGLDVIGGSDWSWFDLTLTASHPIYGDIDGDGIADNGIVADSPGNDVPNGAINWGAWLSQSAIGVASGGTFTNWEAFGVTGIDTPLLGDINGDGRDDRILFRNDFSTFVDYTDGSGGGGFFGDANPDSISSFGGVAGDELGIADINGDGYDDVVVIRANAGGGYYDLFGYYSSAAGLSNGASPDLLGVAGSLADNDYVLFGDLGMPIPEPATAMLMGLGLCGMAFRRRRL